MELIFLMSTLKGFFLIPTQVYQAYREASFGKLSLCRTGGVLQMLLPCGNVYDVI